MSQTNLRFIFKKQNTGRGTGSWGFILTWTKSGMVLSPLMTILLCTSRAKMCRAPVQPSTISSMRTPSCMIQVFMRWKGEREEKKQKQKKHHILDVQIKKTSSLLHTTNCCWLPPMLVRLWVSWWALTSSCTSRGIAPCSRKALWLAGQRARLRIRPTVAYKGRNIWHI